MITKRERYSKNSRSGFVSRSTRAKRRSSGLEAVSGVCAVTIAVSDMAKYYFEVHERWRIVPDGEGLDPVLEAWVNEMGEVEVPGARGGSL
jgi:hypothetical protein